MPKKVSCSQISKKLSAWANVTKYIMGFAFILLFLLGMIMFIIGLVCVADASIIDGFELGPLATVMYTAIILGLFLAIASIVGAIGFFSLHKPLLIAFVCLIGALAVIQVAVGIVGVASSEETLTEYMIDAWSVADNNTRAKFEKTYTCCGGANLTDYPSSQFCIDLNNTNANKTSSSSLILPSSLSSSQYNGPCGAELAKVIEDNMAYIGSGIIVVTVLEIAVVVVTIILVIQIDRAQKKYTKVAEDAEEETLDPLK